MYLDTLRHVSCPFRIFVSHSFPGATPGSRPAFEGWKYDVKMSGGGQTQGSKLFVPEMIFPPSYNGRVDRGDEHGHQPEMTFVNVLPAQNSPQKSLN